MERHRERIEAEHNAGIPRGEWERLEQIIGIFLRTGTIAECAGAYEVDEAELRRWVARIQGRPRGLSMRIHTEATTRPASGTVRRRISRGMDALVAESMPPMLPAQRALLGARARWERAW